YWYGANALPPIASTILIASYYDNLRLIASHVGDPTPATANAFRFFYVSGGLELPAGSLTLHNLALIGGYSKGGDAGYGGGGAGLGGAIFNQGSTTLDSVTVTGNAAVGGGWQPAGSSGFGGGGLGQDATSDNTGTGGGFGPNWLSSYGGA